MREALAERIRPQLRIQTPRRPTHSSSRTRTTRTSRSMSGRQPTFPGQITQARIPVTAEPRELPARRLLSNNEVAFSEACQFVRSRNGTGGLVKLKRVPRSTPSFGVGRVFS